VIIAIPSLNPGKVLHQRQGEEIERVALLGAGEGHRCGPGDGVERDINVSAAPRRGGESRAHDAEQLCCQPPGAGMVDFFKVLAPREVSIGI
jgi:hypothetical protein